MSLVKTRYGDFNIIDTDSVVSGSLKLYGEWAQDEINLLSNFIKSEYVVVDAGSFIGTHAMAFSSFVGPLGKVFAFEARHATASILLENAKLATFDNINVIHSALGAVQGLMTAPAISLNSSENFGSLALNPLENQDDLGEKIKISTIDSCSFERVDFIKIDVEGMEFEVLKGAKNTIERCSPVIFVEANSLEDGMPIIKWSQDCNYQAYGVLSPAYNQENFAGNTENIFGAAQEAGMLLVPEVKSKQFEQTQSKLNLPKINNIDDLALLLLHKPQYPHEILAHSLVANKLSLEYPSPLSESLKKKVKACDLHIKNHENLLAERDSQVVHLTQVVAQNEHHINNHIELLAERNKTIDNIKLELDTLHNEINKIHSTISWKITKPLRKISQLLRRFIRLISFYRDYRKKHPGLSGFRRLFDRSLSAIKKSGIRGLRENISVLEKKSLTANELQFDLPMPLDDLNDNTLESSIDIAVHAHIYYSDMASSIRSYLDNIPVEFHCYVTTDTIEKAKSIENIFSSLKNIRKLDVRVVENRGRDLAPMILNLGEELVKHELVLHLHSKRSPHNPELCGWGRYLMSMLLGSSNRITSILNVFQQNKQLGVFSPQTYLPVIPFMRIGGNAINMAALLRRSGDDVTEVENINQVDFPAGSMFWFRGKVIEPLVKMKLTLDDFDAEAGQCDGTLAHAIERLFPYFAKLSGLDYKSYLPIQFNGSELGSAPLSTFDDYCRHGIFENSIIVFDHNIGGGTNRYSRELINSSLSDERSVLRIYNSNESWVVEWIGVADGMIFADSSADDTFDSLSKVICKDIIVNSLYAYPVVDRMIERIIMLAQRLNASIDYKVHDFYAVCPSQHLLDYSEKYCFVPQNPNECKACLKKNHAAYWASSKAVDIEEWRRPFAKLFEQSSVISVFDISTVDILRKAFKLDDAKFKVTPHSSCYFDSNIAIKFSSKIHIAVLGTLTTVKGAGIVNALDEYIKEQNYNALVTVIGQSYVPTVSGVEVLGPYENKDLSEIVANNGVNVILMPTIVPETFSYTISEAMCMGLPIVAFDIGAQGNRVKEYEFGKVVPLGSSPEVIFSAAQSALNKMLELRK